MRAHVMAVNGYIRVITVTSPLLESEVRPMLQNYAHMTCSEMKSWVDIETTQRMKTSSREEQTEWSVICTPWDIERGIHSYAGSSFYYPRCSALLIIQTLLGSKLECKEKKTRIVLSGESYSSSRTCKACATWILCIYSSYYPGKAVKSL